VVFTQAVAVAVEQVAVLLVDQAVVELVVTLATQ
jgi:hypothetical protein